MKMILAAVMLLLSSFCFAQAVVDVEKTSRGGAPSNLFYAVGGVAISNAKYVALVEGTPYFPEAFSKGKIILSGGKRYDSIRLRLDLIENTVQYVDPGGEELVATTPIRTILLTGIANGKDKRFDNADFIKTTSAITKGWYQLLDTGTLCLYKQYHKSIRENKPYGSATTEQSITTSFHYYILINSVFTPVKKIKALPDMLQDKKTELLEYISNNNLTGKTDEDYIALVAYYNALAGKK